MTYKNDGERVCIPQKGQHSVSISAGCVTGFITAHSRADCDEGPLLMSMLETLEHYSGKAQCFSVDLGKAEWMSLEYQFGRWVSSSMLANFDLLTDRSSVNLGTDFRFIDARIADKINPSWVCPETCLVCLLRIGPEIFLGAIL